MTSEEMNRAIEFIIASQARLAAAQEQDRQDRVEFQEWSKGLTARIVQLLDWQSQRLDRQDQFYRDSLKQTETFQRQALHLLNVIIDRLPPAPMPERT